VNHTINISGSLMDLSTPKVMGVININADSFFSGSRATSEKELITLTEKHLKEGVDIIDIGAMSSRPGAVISDPEVEAEIIKWALNIMKKVYQGYISIDTIHSYVAGISWNEGAHIINDISSGQLDPVMLEVVAKCKMPYIAMHMKGTPDNMQQNPEYENVTKEVIYFFAETYFNWYIQKVYDL
jgi:dihydropteroate synthase